jgi:ElaB/YqjD/DUF883 family membrane-anchored ribosome-binding protein
MTTRQPGGAVVTVTRDILEGAQTYAQRQVSALANRTRELGRLANETLVTSTGRTPDTWVTDAHAYLKTRPVQVLAVTIGVGYLLGKLLRR